MDGKIIEEMSLGDRFVVKSRGGVSGIGAIEIILDTETGVNYLHMAGCLTPLLGSHGGPIVDDD
jgi:hypothetical protein